MSRKETHMPTLPTSTHIQTYKPEENTYMYTYTNKKNTYTYKVTEGPRREVSDGERFKGEGR